MLRLYVAYTTAVSIGCDKYSYYGYEQDYGYKWGYGYK